MPFILSKNLLRSFSLRTKIRKTAMATTMKTSPQIMMACDLSGCQILSTKKPPKRPQANTSEKTNISRIARMSQARSSITVPNTVW